MSERSLTGSGGPTQETDELLLVINNKLKANAEFVSKSMAYGRLTWRKNNKGVLDVKLDLTI